jgi:hypothetical protein
VPLFSSGTNANLAENTATTTVVYDAQATIAGGATDAGLSYTLGGLDVALFNINSANGQVTFTASPNYEVPTDAGANNVYDINVIATDANANTTSKAVAITVSNVVEAGDPVISLGAGMGNLIAPVTEQGGTYYYWDRSGDGSSDLNGGVDYTTLTSLIPLFSHTITDGVGAAAGSVIDESHHYAWINGVHLSLPTIGAAFPGSGFYMPGTVANTTYSGLLGIWDSQNASGTVNNGGEIPGTVSYGTPAGWQALRYMSATPSDSGHVGIHPGRGSVYDTVDGIVSYVALQVL